MPVAAERIHPTAVIAAGAQLAEDVTVGPYAVIEGGVVIGPRCEIRAHAVVKRYTTLGSDNVVYEHAVLGNDPQDVSFDGSPTTLVIGDRNRFREGVTVHRGTRATGTTIIGSDCFIMGYVHIAHDCRIGDRVIMANNVALAGHVHVGERAFLSGGVVVHQFTHIGRLAMIGGNAKIVGDCLPFVITDGVPGNARGLNVVGLRRAGMTAADVRTLRTAYRTLLRSALPLADGLGRLSAMHHPLADELVAFVRNSRRGFARARRTTHTHAEE
jgi:UDP-N-acetylglucosamine acyltransferase